MRVKHSECLWVRLRDDVVSEALAAGTRVVPRCFVPVCRKTCRDFLVSKMLPVKREWKHVVK